MLSIRDQFFIIRGTAEGRQRRRRQAGSRGGREAAEEGGARKVAEGQAYGEAGSRGGRSEEGSRGEAAEEARKFLDGVMTESRTVYLTDFQDFRLVSSIADNGPVCTVNNIFYCTTERHGIMCSTVNNIF